MALRKQHAPAEQLVPIAEVLAHLAGDGSSPESWQVQAEEVAGELRAR